MRLIHIIVLSLLAKLSFAQLVLNGGAKVVVNGGTSVNPIFVVLNVPTANPIITSGSTNGILLEDEYNRLQYNLSTGTTAITVPFMSSLLESFPFTLTPSAAGSGTGNIRFSSRRATTRASGFDNVSYVPSDVTNMAAPGIANNSNMTIDRFWIIDANGYTTKPSVTLDFTYIDAEWAANGGNIISEANLQAQRFNPGVSDWEGYTTYPPAGTINITTNRVSGVTASAANFFKSWTLNDFSIPLLVELLSFTAECLDGNTVLNWCTASETNNDFFTLYGSSNGIDFVQISTVSASINPYQKNCYNYVLPKDNSNSRWNYFKLSQTDRNGLSKELSLVYATACEGKQVIKLTNNGSQNPSLFINSENAYVSDWSLLNGLGQNLKSGSIEINKGINSFGIDVSDLSSGVYLLQLLNGENKISSFKLIVTN